MKKIIMTFTALSLVLSVPALAETTTKVINNTTVKTTSSKARVNYKPVSEKTAKFISEASMGGAFEIASSKVAVRRSSNKDVVAFAEMMIKDHGMANKELLKIVAASDIDPSLVKSTVGGKKEATITRLSNEVDREFDEEYMEAQEKAHKETIALFKDYAENGDVQALKDFASDKLPALKEHGKQASRLEDLVD